MTSSTAALVDSPGASIRSTVKTECGGLPWDHLPVGLPQASGNSVPIKAVPSSVRRVSKRGARARSPSGASARCPFFAHSGLGSTQHLRGWDERRVMDPGSERSSSGGKTEDCRSLVVSGDMYMLAANAGHGRQYEMNRSALRSQDWVSANVRHAEP